MRMRQGPGSKCYFPAKRIERADVIFVVEELQISFPVPDCRKHACHAPSLSVPCQSRDSFSKFSYANNSSWLTPLL